MFLADWKKYHDRTEEIEWKFKAHSRYRQKEFFPHSQITPFVDYLAPENESCKHVKRGKERTVRIWKTDFIKVRYEGHASH